MRLAFISDVHGNAIALEAVLKDLEEKKVDKVFVLGDLCYRGPEPKRSLELVQSINCQVVKGNADEWVVRGVAEGEVPGQALEMMRQEREWTYSHLSEDDVGYLQALPTEIVTTIEGVKIHVFHATPNSLFEVVVPFAEDDVIQEKLMEREADLYLYGHIHTPYIRFLNGKAVVNLGSVGLPFDGLNQASYSLVDIENGSIQASIVRVKYDLDKVMDMLQTSDYPNKEFLVNVWRNGRL